MMLVNIAAEGRTDEQLMRAVVRAAGHDVGRFRPAGGKAKLDTLIPKYNLAARQEAWVVFRDSDTHCPVKLRTDLESRIVQRSPRFILRVVHPMAEAWLLADGDSFSRYFQIKRSLLPEQPELLHDAKKKLLHICQQSRSSRLRKDLVRKDRPGPLYTETLNEFAEQAWDAERAAIRCGSLERAIAELRKLQ